MALDNIIDGVEVLQLKYQAVMAVVLGTVNQNLVAALTFDKLSLGPEFRVKFDYNISYLFIAQHNILAL